MEFSEKVNCSNAPCVNDDPQNQCGKPVRGRSVSPATGMLREAGGSLESQASKSS